LIFLPGALGSTLFWAQLRAELAVNADMIVMSYPGFDGTPSDPEVSGMDGLVDSLVRRVTQPTALVAQSMGGVLAIEAALSKPQLITHLVLIATSGGLDTALYGAIDWRKEFSLEHPDLPGWFASYDEDLTRRLKELEMPVLLLWGDRDPISPVAIGEEFLSSFRRAQLHIVPNAGHNLAQTHSSWIAPLIAAFLEIENNSSASARHTPPERLRWRR
jgi:pimeloyl-ACP methyl ester carboxylesterase